MWKVTKMPFDEEDELDIEVVMLLNDEETEPLEHN